MLLCLVNKKLQKTMNLNSVVLKIPQLFQISKISVRCVTTTRVNFLFMESDPKSGYNKDTKKPPFFKLVKNGFKELHQEFEKFKLEMLEKFRCDPIIFLQPGVVQKQWQLSTEEDLKNWNTTCDSDHGEGFSSCELILNSQGFGLFKGNLDTTVPKDGRLKRTGYCTIRTNRPRKSFGRDSCINWNCYTHLILKIRGDGRTYMINLATTGYFDQLWNDMYQYVLCTRGGPYWQITKIPFSKFFLTSKGRIQDKQYPIPLHQITNFGITASDNICGPFSLEIDYIGIEFDPTHTEEFSYEMYRTPKYVVGS